MAIDIVLKPRVRVKAGSSLTVKATEGQPRPGPWLLPSTGAWLPAEVGSNWNWWQEGFDPERLPSTAMVEACISAYAQTVAMCPGDHWNLHPDGGRQRVTTSALSRFLKRPNGYQTISDFLLNLIYNLYSDGNAYVLLVRNSRFEVTEMHLMASQQSRGMVAGDGSIFYQLAGNTILERLFDYPLLVPARDVMHIRLKQSIYNPLMGVGPIVSAAMDIASGDAMAKQQLSFYLNQARPSMVLQTDLTLDATQVTMLRDKWNEQSRGLQSGGTPILTSGLKPVMLSSTALDSQLAEIMKMNEQHIALAFRVPLQILGIGGSNFGSTEALMQSWLASSLGFCLNHVEESIGRAFGLSGYPDDYVELNTAALLRSAQKDRIESLARAVQGGIFSPDEARQTEGYAKVPGGFGAEPRVQQQVVPLSAASAIPAAPPAPSAPAAPTATSDSVAASKEFSDVEVYRIKQRFRSSHQRQLSI